MPISDIAINEGRQIAEKIDVAKLKPVNVALSSKCNYKLFFVADNLACEIKELHCSHHWFESECGRAFSDWFFVDAKTPESANKWVNEFCSSMNSPFLNKQIGQRLITVETEWEVFQQWINTVDDVISSPKEFLKWLNIYSKNKVFFNTLSKVVSISQKSKKMIKGD